MKIFTKTTTFTIVFFAALVAKAQVTFQDSIEDGRGVTIKNILPAKDGGYYAAGYSTWDGSLYVHKIDAAGSRLWSKSYDGGYKELLDGITVTKDGGFIISASSLDAADADINESKALLIKCDKTGNVEWKKKYQVPSRAVVKYERDTSTYGGAVIQTKDGGYLVASLTGEFWVGTRYVLLSKFDADGNQLWNTVLSSIYAMTSSIEALHETADGQLFVGVNYNECSGYCYRSYLHKFSANGKLQLSTYITFPDYEGDFEFTHFAAIQSDNKGLHMLLRIFRYYPYNDYHYAYQLLKTDDKLTNAIFIQDNIFALKNFLQSRSISAFTGKPLPQSLENFGINLLESTGAVITGSSGFTTTAGFVTIKKYNAANAVCPAYVPVLYNDTLIRSLTTYINFDVATEKLKLVELPVNITVGTPSSLFYVNCWGGQSMASIAVADKLVAKTTGNFGIYPNPAKTFVQIKAPVNAKMELLNSTGVLLKTFTVTETQKLSVTDLPAGLYYLRDDKGNVQKLLVIK